MLAILWVFLSAAPGCHALCECIGTSDVQTSLKGADAVFVGRVLAARDTSQGVSAAMKRLPTRALTFLITQSWKGPRDTVVVFTGYGLGDCGYPFEVGETYLVYAGNVDGSAHPPVVFTGICSRTASALAAAQDIAALNRLAGVRR